MGDLQSAKRTEYRSSFFKNDADVFEVFQRFGKKPEDLGGHSHLFHYTDAGGLQGIVQKQVIWATHHEYTNDFKEVRHGLEIILEEIRKILPPSDHSNWKFEDCFKKDSVLDPKHLLLQLLEEMIDKKRRLFDFFIVCFSEKGNLLSQWRAYARDATGYSLGYLPSDLGNLHRDLSEEPVQLLSVIYAEEEQRAFARDVLDLLLRNIDSCAAKIKNEIDPATCENFREGCRNFLVGFHATAFKWILAAAVRLKHEGFSEEREWRLIYPATSGNPESSAFSVNHRTSNGQLTPYIAIPLKAHIRKIWIGPKQAKFESRVSDYAVRSLFWQAKVAEPPEIVISDIPYR